MACDAEAMLMVNVTKMYHQPDCESFDAFGRVLSGTLKVGQDVKVLGETYSLEDQEDSAVKTISKLWLHQSRYRVEVTPPRSRATSPRSRRDLAAPTAIARPPFRPR